MAHLSLSRPALLRFARFSVVGALAFMIDIAILLGLIRIGLSPFLARAISIPAAMLAAWQMNRRFTFAASGRSALAEGSRYVLIATLAALINYSVFSALIAALPGLWPALAAGLGVGVSMTGSFLGFQHYAFARKPVSQHEQ